MLEDVDQKGNRAAGSAARRNGPRDNPRKELVREELIDKAAEIFNSKGFAQTSMADIAKAVGLGRSAVYHYFRNKEEILSALLEQEAVGPDQALQELARRPGLTATERLRQAIVEGIVRRLTGGARFIVLGRLEAELPEEIEKVYNASKRRILDHYSSFIAEGIRNGEFRTVDVKVAAFAVIGMANWTSHWYSPLGTLKPAEIGALIADFAIRALRIDDSSRDRADTLDSIIQLLREDVGRLERLAR